MAINISPERWHERVARLVATSKISNPIERAAQAHFDADKEMLNEIHAMLRHLCREVKEAEEGGIGH